jgi:hypothetical protein
MKHPGLARAQFNSRQILVADHWINSPDRSSQFPGNAMIGYVLVLLARFPIMSNGPPVSNRRFMQVTVDGIAVLQQRSPPTPTLIYLVRPAFRSGQDLVRADAQDEQMTIKTKGRRLLITGH